MSSKKPRSNGKNNGKGNHYSHQGAENNGSVGKAARDNLNEFQIAKLWEDIFASPEFEQDIKESDFQDFSGKSSKPGDHREGIKDRKVVSKLLTGTFSNKLNILGDAIREIEDEIDERIELGKVFRKRINTEVSKCKAMLKLIEDYTVGYNPTIEFRRSSFERQIFVLTKELRAEDLRAWGDIISLMKERRNLEMEYKALINTRKMLSK